MNFQRTLSVSGFLASFSSTSTLLKKSEKVKSVFLLIFLVEKCRNCGVERENFLKILWKSEIPPRFFSHSVESDLFEKVEIHFMPL